MVDLFVNAENAEKFLIEKRTSNAISSIITEDYFRKIFLHKNNAIKKKTTGWYYTISVTDKEPYIFILKEDLNELDIEIIKKIEGNIWQIFINETDLYLGKIEQARISERFSMEDFITKYKLNVKVRENKQSSKLEQAKSISYCQYLNEKGQLIQASSIAYIEDYFLNKYFFVTNIDFFVKNELGIILLEIKFKYPAANRTYGINRLQYNALSFFKQNGIRVYNIILNNPNRKDALDYIGAGVDEEEWLYAKFDDSVPLVLKTAPSKTSFFESEEQQYYEVSVVKYKKLRRKNNFIDMKCPVCGADMIPKIGPYSEFLGCKNFKKEDCRGKIELE